MDLEAQIEEAFSKLYKVDAYEESSRECMIAYKNTLDYYREGARFMLNLLKSELEGDSYCGCHGFVVWPEEYTLKEL